jgi:hypothetical protein
MPRGVSKEPIEYVFNVVEWAQQKAGGKQIQHAMLVHADVLHGLFHPVDGGNMFLRNVVDSTGFAALYCRMQCCPNINENRKLPLPFSLI